MSKEKQTIEEMAKIIREADVQYAKERVKAIEHDLIEPIPPRGTYIASKLYDAGYSKQSVGEWKRDSCGNTKKCSICGETVTFKSKYCPECGAKMKGGTENEPKRIY